jgi:succinylglutamate desuccinylase
MISRMGFGRETENFTPLKKGDVIATDGDTVYTVQHDEEMRRVPEPRMCGRVARRDHGGEIR